MDEQARDDLKIENEKTEQKQNKQIQMFEERLVEKYKLQEVQKKNLKIQQAKQKFINNKDI